MDLSYKMVQDIPKVIGHYWKERSFNWPMIIYISLVHSAALYGVAKLSLCSRETLLWAFILWPIRYVFSLYCSYIVYLLYFDFYFGLDLTVHVYPTDGYCYFVFVFNAIIFLFLSTVFHLISHSILLFFYLYSHYFYFLQWIWYYSWCTSIMVTSIIRGACSTTMHSYVM
jgi:hypothetical protein